MKRETKFRAWDSLNSKWIYFRIGETWTEIALIVYHRIVLNGGTFYQFTGLLDKNGKEIYEGDLLRIKGTMGDEGEYKYDAIYRVNNLNYEGIGLSFTRLFTATPDDRSNSYPICQSPCFKYRSLSTDYVNNKYDSLAIPDTTGENHMSRRTWKEHHYTNDIEVVGNIHEHPHLLSNQAKGTK